MRTYLKQGTWVRLPGGDCYEILGAPIGEGGGSLIYPAVRQLLIEGKYKQGNLFYVLKECFPLSSIYSFTRTDTGEIVPESETEESMQYLHTVQTMQMDEKDISARIYATGFRLTPIIDGAVKVELSFDKGKSFCSVDNTVTIMESLSKKGYSLKHYLQERRCLPVATAFRVIEQVLMAVREVHNAGFLHLDIQDGNVFIKGSLEDNSDFASLIDFGSARKRLEDGKCAPVNDRVIFSTHGFSAPEIAHKNDGSLRLGPEADLYSIGYLLLLLLTGQKYRPEELYHVTDGHYLTRYRLRKIKCPKHLVEKMQLILAHALENSPEDRYHSAAEMLADVSDFVKALQPYRSDLANTSYDAFICYKHGPVDSAAASALQRYLEHFHISRKLNNGKSKINRVFVDEGELSSCADFGLQIREALKNAGWLIVICSPETKTSPWVNLEIKTFLEFHDRSRILAVMTSGEPEDIFPDALLGQNGNGDEVLAADARGQDLNSILKRLKKDALLRIAAPILGTTYDSLKQRHRTYLLQRAAAILSVALVLFLAFTIHTLWQSSQINEQYQQARRNQARYLSSISLDLLDSGNRNKALLTALAIGPENDADGAVVPEQMYALNSALTSYKSGLTIDYDPAYTGEVSDVSFGTLSPDGAYYYAIDGDGNAAVLSGETGKLQWAITPSDIKESIDDLYRYDGSEDFSEVRLIYPVSEDRVAIGLQYCMAIADVKSHEIIHTFPLDSCIISNGTAYDFNGNLFANANNGALYVYDVNTGKRTDYLNLNKDSDHTLIEYKIESISIAENNTAIALGLSYTYSDGSYQFWSATAEEIAAYTEASNKWFSQNPPAGLILYGRNDQTLTVLSTVQTQEVLFADEKHVAAIHFSNPVSGTELRDSWGDVNYSYYQTLYEIPSGNQLYLGETTTVLNTSKIGMATEELEIEGEMISALITWIRGNLVIVDINSGKVLTEITYQSDIIGMSSYDGNRLFISLYNGTVHMIVLKSEIARFKVLSISANVTQYTYNSAADEIILISNGNLIFCNNEADSGMNLYQTSDFTSDEMQIKDIQYVEVAGNRYRYLRLYQDSGTNICEILVFPADSDECIYQYKSSQPDNNISNIGFGYYQDNIYISFVEESSNGQTIFTKENLTTGQMMICEDVSAYSTLHFTTSVIYSSDMNTIFVERSEGVVKFDISGNSLITDDRAILDRQDIESMDITGDGQYLVLSKNDYEKNNRYIYIYNIKSGTLNQLDIDADFSSDYISDFVISGLTSSCICLYDGGDTIYVVDCETGSVVSTVSTDSASSYEVSFFDNDQYLILVNGSIITMYDIKNEKITYTYTSSISAFGLNIITDSSSHYFAIKDTSISENLQSETGIISQPLYIFYVDDEHQFYPYADIDYGYASLSGLEVSTCMNDCFSYTEFYDYAYLKERAIQTLDGQTLTADEKQEYFITE